MSEVRNWIQIRGARTHNLRDVSTRIPLDGITVIAGVSGSGKSSLAFDTLFLEGQCRFLDTLSASARRIMDRIRRPDTDDIENLPATQCVRQSAPRGDPRATLGTVTEVHDLLSLLFARCGKVHCERCGAPVGTRTFDAMVDFAASLAEGTRILILAPMLRKDEGVGDAILRIRREGFLRARIDGEVLLLDDLPPPGDSRSAGDPRYSAGSLEAVIDRQVVRQGMRDRLAESLATAMKVGNGAAVISRESDGRWIDERFAARNLCTGCGHRMTEVEPNAFSFNSPVGACPECQGLGSLDQDECPACDGTRLGSLSRCVSVAGATIGQINRMCIDEAAAFFAPQGAAASALADAPKAAVDAVLGELARRLDFLNRVGIGYLQLERPVGTLSGGEAHRARLAGCVCAGSTGILFVLDEPTAGLHARDARKLWDIIVELKRRGNAVVVVEHDEWTIRQADWLIELGPGAGRDGGRVVFEGAPRQLAELEPHSRTLTADYLFGSRSVRPEVVDRNRRMPEAPRASNGDSSRLVLSGVRFRNLAIDRLELPLGRFVCITGVSGSGKSTFVRDVLAPTIRHRLGSTRKIPEATASISGFDAIGRVIEVDQSPLADSSRSTPATATGLWDEIRRLLSQSRMAKLRGFPASRFSYLNKAGQCSECRGLGRLPLDLTFLSDAYELCPTCSGRRFNSQTLSVEFMGRNAAEFLDMTVDEAAIALENFPKAAAILKTLQSIGLGYLQLGQPGDTLSGGESQRIKLAAELAKAVDADWQPVSRTDRELATSGNVKAKPQQLRQGKPTLFILDEPTSGLHFHDIHFLLATFDRLTAVGHSLIVAEHHLDVIAAADWLIDLGPEGGPRIAGPGLERPGGGRVVAEGAPDRVARDFSTPTAAALADWFRLRKLPPEQ